jgi:hypothetical protein
MQKNGGAQTLGEASRRISGDLGDLARAIKSSRDELTERIGAFVRDRPVASIAIAFGIGYVLAGGLLTRTTSRLLGLGARAYGVALARNLMGDALTRR